MKLYYSPGACSLASHITLFESGVKFESEMKATKDKAGLMAIHAKGYVPMLKLDNGEILTEGVAIMQYVADQKPETGLMPKTGTLERYRALEMLNYISTEIHKGYGPLWAAQGLVADEKAREGFIAAVKANLSKRLTWLDEQLAGKEYLMGNTFTVCDAYLFTCFSWSKYINFDTTQFKNLSAWSSRVYARPAVQSAMKAEGLLK